tara:strand:+ start:229 stop:519 length:291 start_codon:yes stop_codon:yes gene_type:complete
MSKYLNKHDLYKLPDRSSFEDNFRKNYIYDDKINNCNSSLELFLIQKYKFLQEEVENVMNFINENFGDLNDNEKKILLTNLIKAEQFTPAKRYLIY